MTSAQNNNKLTKWFTKHVCAQILLVTSMFVIIMNTTLIIIQNFLIILGKQYMENWTSKVYSCRRSIDLLIELLIIFIIIFKLFYLRRNSKLMSGTLSWTNHQYADTLHAQFLSNWMECKIGYIRRLYWILLLVWTSTPSCGVYNPQWKISGHANFFYVSLYFGSPKPTH